jgi:hypothetical protein
LETLATEIEWALFNKKQAFFVTDEQSHLYVTLAELTRKEQTSIVDSLLCLNSDVIDRYARHARNR